MKAELGCHCIAIGWKSVLLDNDFVARLRGPEEAHHEQMKIHRQRVHGGHFVCRGANQLAQRRCELSVIVKPGSPAMEVTRHAMLAPLIQFLVDIAARPPRQQPQGMATQVV